MAVYDILMLCLIAMTTLRGSTKGIAWQLAGIVSLVLCFVFATPLSANLAPMVPLQPPLNRWAAMLGVYLLFSFGCFSVARMFRGALETAKFEAFDKHLGALFGFIKGITLCFVITFFAVCMSDAAADHILRTNTGYVTARAMQQLEPMLPAEVANILRKAAGQPPLEYDPLFAQGQTTIGPDGLPTTDPTGRSALPPGSVQNFDNFSEWREPDENSTPLDSARRYPTNGTPVNPNAAPGVNPPLASNPGGPLTRANLFGRPGTAPGVPSNSGAAPPIANLLDKVPQVLNQNGSVAEKALGAIRDLLPGNSPAAPQPTPPSAAPPTGSSPPFNSFGRPSAPPAGTNLQSFGRSPDDDEFFPPQPSTPGNPPARSAVPPSATLPRENLVPLQDIQVPFQDDAGPPQSAPPISGPPRSFDDNPLPPRSSVPPIPNSSSGHRNRFDEDESEGSRISPRINSSSGSRTRIAPAPGDVAVDPFSGPGTPTITPRSRSGDVTDVAPRSRFTDDEEPISSRVAPAPGSFGPRSGSVPSELISTQEEINRRGSRTLPPPIRSAPVPGTDLRSDRGAQIRPGENRPPRDRTEEIRQLISGIAVLLAPPANRAALESDIQRSLANVPQNIAASALRDWQADLLGSERDPGPESDVSTPLETRVRLARERRERRKAATSGANPAGGPRREIRTPPPTLDRF